MKYLLAVALLLMSGQSWSCTCFDTSSIEEKSKPGKAWATVGEPREGKYSGSRERFLDR
jgi:hypothetical protein